MRTLIASRMRHVVEVLQWIAVFLAVPLVLMFAGCAVAGLWVGLFPPKPAFTLTVYNRGQLAIVRGNFSGDSQWRPVGGIHPGRATAFVLKGSSGHKDLNYRLHLVRSDSSRVLVEIGWVTGDSDPSSMDHSAAVIESDTTQSVGLVRPMDSQNRLMAELRGKHLIDEARP